MVELGHRRSVTPSARARAQEVQLHLGKLQHWGDIVHAAQVPSPTEVLHTLDFFYRKLKLQNLAPLAQALFRLKGKPYAIADKYYPMEPMFSVKVPRRLVWKTARQVSKSTSGAARLCTRSILLPHYSTLVMAPRWEQIRRLSSNYVRPFIENSPFSSLFNSSSTDSRVEQRSLVNESMMHFSFAFLDCERVRGISCNELIIDECQDMNFDFLDVIRECMSGSPYGPIEAFLGTPKTLDNTLEKLWDESSQAEWIMTCGCGHDNIPNYIGKVIDMIQKQGPTCIKCGRLLNPAEGRWVHAYGERIPEFSGYHIPQLIMPIHWQIPEKWDELVHKKMIMPVPKLMNEVLGESCDFGTKLVSLTQLKDACILPWGNTLEEAVKVRKKYSQVVMGVDWGGHGLTHTSFTTISIIAPVGGGKHHCIYGERIHSTATEGEEMARVLKLFKLFRCAHLAHDYGGAGSTRETILIHSGMPHRIIMPVEWGITSKKDIVSYTTHPNSSRAYYTADKTKCLGLTLAMIKSGMYFFPKYDSAIELFNDWLALIEEKHEMPRRSDYRLIKRDPNKSDDFAHSCTFASICIWWVTDSWPDLGKAFGTVLSDADREFLDPEDAWSHPPTADWAIEPEPDK